MRELVVRAGIPERAQMFERPSERFHTLLVDAVTGGPVHLQTRVSLAYDEERLQVWFEAEDREILATMTERDAPLWKEDVVEIFIAPQDLTHYFEFEINPLGALFDAAIVSPEGSRRSMESDVTWNVEDLWGGVQRSERADGVALVTYVLSIPFGGLARPPKSGQRWRGNLFRIDRSAEGVEYSAWSPTLSNPADFHVPAAFGEFIFE